MFTSSRARLGVLAFGHFAADFYFGICIPLPEPTLVRHLSVDLLAVMAILSTCAIIVNAIQPVGGVLLPKRGLPMILVAGPLMAAGTACIGLTAKYWAVAGMLATAAAGIGILHNEAVLTVQSLTRRRHGLSMSVFMSGGYFGAATGALVSGWWAQNFGLDYFWIFSFPGLAMAALVLVSGLHRLRPHAEEELAPTDGRGLAFVLVLALAISVASANVVIMRLMPVYIVRFFGAQAQVWGGAVFFVVGVAGAFGSYLWGYLSGRYDSGVLIVAAWLVGAPCLYQLLHLTTPQMVLFWGAGVGFSIGGVFPLTVVLARTARGWTRRLRLGCIIGGSWGLGEVVVLGISKYIDRFEPGAVEPVATGLGVCWVLVALTLILGTVTARAEYRERKAAQERVLAPVAE
jgi:MFS family permease